MEVLNCIGIIILLLLFFCVATHHLTHLDFGMEKKNKKTKEENEKSCPVPIQKKKVFFKKKIQLKLFLKL